MSDPTLLLNSPITEEQWDMITDVDFEHTSAIEFTTKHGKKVTFYKERPSAPPERKSGEWIYDGVKRICPFCMDFIVTGRSIVKYCWNCGARLKERSEDEKIHQQC